MCFANVRLYGKERADVFRCRPKDVLFFFWAWHPDSVPHPSLVVDVDAVRPIVDYSEGLIRFLYGPNGGNAKGAIREIPLGLL